MVLSDLVETVVQSRAVPGGTHTIAASVDRALIPLHIKMKHVFHCLSFSKKNLGVPFMAQWKQIQLGTMRLRV